jgi:hypothetical protein
MFPGSLLPQLTARRQRRFLGSNRGFTFSSAASCGQIKAKKRANFSATRTIKENGGQTQRMDEDRRREPLKLTFNSFYLANGKQQ